MDAGRMIARLEAGAAILRGIAEAVPEEETARTPAGGGWSIREVLGHLLSEESEDFRARLDFVLRVPGGSWPPLDPERRVREGGYRERPARELLAAFLAEREKSLVWLRGLGGFDGTKGKPHPRGGTLTAGDLLASWAAHDLLHARQMIRILHGRVVEEGAPHGTRYAGEW